MKYISMLRGCAVVAALSVVVACTGSVDGPRIQPITGVGADDGDTDERETLAVGDNVEVVEGDGRAGVTDERGTPAVGDNVEVVEGDGRSGGAEVETGDGVVARDGIAQTIDPTTVPDPITPAYVEAVLQELEALYADALASHVAAGEPTLESVTKLGSAFSEPAYARRLQYLTRLGQEGFVHIADADRIRPRSHTDIQLLAVDDGCVYVETRLDASPALTEPRPVVVSFVHLGPRDREIFDDVNPTPWLIHKMPGGDPETLRELDPCVE